MEGDHRIHRRARRLAGRGDRRVVQVGDGDQLQQQVDRMAAEELQPHLRRPGHGAGHLHAPVFDRRDGQAARHDGGDDRQRRQEPRDQTTGLQARAVAQNRLNDGDRGFLRAHGRLALHDGAPGQDGRGRRHHGRRPGRDGRSGLRPAARRGRQLGQGTEGAGLHRRAPQPQYFRHHALRDGREGSGAGVDLRRQLGKRPAHVMRRPFPLRDAPGGKNREGAKKNGYGRTNNSDAVQGRRIHRPNRTRRRHTTCGLRKKSKGAGANSPTGLANRFWKLPLRPSRPGTRPGHSKGFRQIYARRTCHIT